MQRNRLRPSFWPGYNQSLAFKVPNPTFQPNQFCNNWQWRGCVPPVRGTLYNWRQQFHPRLFNPFDQPLSRTPGLPPQSLGRKVRRLNNNQFQQIRPSPVRFSNFHTKNRRRSLKVPNKPVLNPNDPLNLQDLMNETDRRRIEGLSPLRGDSRVNTPALSVSGELNGSSPAVGSAITANLNQTALQRVRNKKNQFSFRGGASLRGRNCLRNFRRNRWQGNRLPITGNYPNYYSRRDPDDRIKFLMPEWFSNCDVADYGCHNGTLTFRILEKFPDVHRIDAFDCDAELIENAKSMQRERIRWGPQSNAKFDKINFQVSDWSESSSSEDEPTYSTILAFSVTKWIHLNYGDAGLMRFFRRVFNLLKPGGHLLLEPQPRSSYKKTRFTVKQQERYKTLTIDPANLEPLLLDIGFSYFDKIKIPQSHETFQRSIILCSKSYGATPSSIRNDCRDEAQLWRGSPSVEIPALVGPPPVSYTPLTPNYTALVSPRPSSTHITTPGSSTHTPDSLQSEVSSSCMSATVINNATEGTLGGTTLDIPLMDDLDSTITVPDSTSDQ